MLILLPYSLDKNYKITLPHLDLCTHTSILTFDPRQRLDSEPWLKNFSEDSLHLRLPLPRNHPISVCSRCRTPLAPSWTSLRQRADHAVAAWWSEVKRRCWAGVTLTEEESDTPICQKPEKKNPNYVCVLCANEKVRKQSQSLFCGRVFVRGAVNRSCIKFKVQTHDRFALSCRVCIKLQEICSINCLYFIAPSIFGQYYSF